MKIDVVDRGYVETVLAACLSAFRPAATAIAIDQSVVDAINAAKKLRFRLLHAGQKSPHGGATRHTALKLGTLNVNGGYSPATQ